MSYVAPCIGLFVVSALAAPSVIPAAAAPAKGPAVNYVELLILRVDDQPFSFNGFFLGMDVITEAEPGVTAVTVTTGNGTVMTLEAEDPDCWVDELALTTFADVLTELSGTWTIDITATTNSTTTFTFDTNSLLESDLYGLATITNPTHEETGVSPATVMMWTDPTGGTAEALLVEIEGVTDNSFDGTLNTTDTSWDPPGDLEPGYKEADVVYVDFDDNSRASALNVTSGTIVWGDSPIAPSGYATSTALVVLGSDAIIWFDVLDPCPADTNDDNNVNVSDLLALLGAWGPCDASCPPCLGDTNGDCNVDVSDLLHLLGAWGPCP